MFVCLPVLQRVLEYIWLHDRAVSLELGSAAVGTCGRSSADVADWIKDAQEV